MTPAGPFTTDTTQYPNSTIPPFGIPAPEYNNPGHRAEGSFFGDTPPESGTTTDTSIFNSTRHATFNIEAKQRQMLKQASVEDVLRQYADRRAHQPEKPGKHGIVAQASAVWRRNGRTEDATRLHALFPKLHEFFRRYWELIQNALQRSPELKEAIVDTGSQLAQEAVKLLVASKDPCLALTGQTGASIEGQARRSVEQAQLSATQKEIDTFYRHADKSFMGASLNDSEFNAIHNLYAGNVVLKIGPANLRQALAKLPAGYVKHETAPFDRERVNAPTDVTRYALAGYPKMPWPGMLETISAISNDGTTQRVLLVCIGDRLKASFDLGATWEVLGTTSDALEQMKRERFLEFKRWLTMKVYLPRKAVQVLGSSHY